MTTDGSTHELQAAVQNRIIHHLRLHGPTDATKLLAQFKFPVGEQALEDLLRLKLVVGEVEGFVRLPAHRPFDGLVTVADGQTRTAVVCPYCIHRLHVLIPAPTFDPYEEVMTCEFTGRSFDIELHGEYLEPVTCSPFRPEENPA